MLDRWPISSYAVPGWFADDDILRLDFRRRSARLAAMHLREAEVPFVLTNVPNVRQAALKWSFEYLSLRMATQGFRVEESTLGNQFMYFHKMGAGGKGGASWVPPQNDIDMSFARYWSLAARANASVTGLGPGEKHYYLTIGAAQSSPWVDNDLAIFSRQGRGFETEEGFRFVLEPASNKGVNCRFGMKGTWSTAHYDGKRNFVAMVRGAKRYILLSPSECGALSLLPRGHPSARHSSIDWRSAAAYNADAAFRKARAVQTVVREGEVLYIPSFWFHAPVSLETTVQCNTRSGKAHKGQEAVQRCGF
eukprot:g5724.t1